MKQQEEEEEQQQDSMILESRSRMRPNRSDIHVSMEEEMEMEGKTRDHFDALAPKRPSKPHRSDVFYSSSSSSDSDHHTTSDTTSPEFVKFQQLQQQNDDHHPHQKKLVVDSGSQEEVAEEEEEYTETDYYKDLNCIDKQHHTTGTGFISVVAEEGEEEKSSSGYDCRPQQQQLHSSSCKGNPATNDWIPSDQVIMASSDDDVILASHHKPNRSEN